MAKPAKGILAKFRRSQPEPAPEPELGEDRLAALRFRAAVAEDPNLAIANDDSPQAHALQGLDPVVLVRKPRDRDSDWSEASSWFGGLPKLGAIAWPTGSDGRPLPFAAQIGAADLAAAGAGAVLPFGGSLAFFLGEGAVIHVPGGIGQFSPAPEDLPLAYDEGGATFPASETLLGRALFPFWPVEAVRSAAAADLGRPEQPFAAADLPGDAWDGPVPVWWHGVDHLIAQLSLALDRAGGEASEGQRDGLSALIGALDGFAAERDPWTRLSPEEREVFVEALDNAWQQFGGLLAFPMRSAEDLATLSLRAMITGDDEAFAALPPAVRDLIGRDHRLPAGALPEMFGTDAETGEVRLLQLASDDLMEWRFPDDGVYRFRIGAGDLADGHWNAARLAFAPR